MMRKMEENTTRRFSFAIILGALTAIGPLSIDMYLPALPKLATELATPVSFAQLSLTACLLGIAAGQVVIGPLSDRRGRKMPLLVSLFVYALASLWCVFSQHIVMLIVLRFIQGAAGAGGIVIARAMVRDLFSGTEMTKFVSLLTLINGAAPILAPVIGGQLLHFTSWRGIFVTLFLLSLVMIISAAIGLPETLAKENKAVGGMKETLITYGKLVRDRQFMGYASAQGFVMAAMFAYISGSPFVLQTVFHVSPQGFSLLFALNGLGIILGSAIAGKLAGTVKEESILKGGLLLAVVGSLLMLVVTWPTHHLIGLLIALFLTVSSVGVVSTASFTLAMEKQQRSAGAAAALLGLLPFILGGVLAPLVGLGHDLAATMSLVIALCEGIGFLLFITLTRQSVTLTRGNNLNR
ncbi:drug resistance transporter [Fictibacillus macauensis ZFHKF-1]|uniref:Bcr/CflA family efflux transporter n=1 Tax=Fictibacillus macauensis ZFHKF-1 TaxID=1196324 RepID=I8ALF9_9BACL|nr:multidrug effflux MFS transporter [Fictibacillus macauensis]EIT86737.1 drug resistance transporter [Fictibacillus macauensis ZFHKF-1]